MFPVCILENIQGHQDLKQLNSKQRTQLCKEIRDFLISHVAKTGGHVSSNMGVVELTVALETVFDTSVDMFDTVSTIDHGIRLNMTDQTDSL